jgi:hypothetical protein
MSNQNVTDNFPTIKAPLKAWPIMPAAAYMALPGEVVRTIEPHTEYELLPGGLRGSQKVRDRHVTAHFGASSGGHAVGGALGVSIPALARNHARTVQGLS